MKKIQFLILFLFCNFSLLLANCNYCDNINSNPTLTDDYIQHKVCTNPVINNTVTIDLGNATYHFDKSIHIYRDDLANIEKIIFKGTNALSKANIIYDTPNNSSAFYAFRIGEENEDQCYESYKDISLEFKFINLDVGLIEIQCDLNNLDLVNVDVIGKQNAGAAIINDYTYYAEATGSVKQTAIHKIGDVNIQQCHIENIIGIMLENEEGGNLNVNNCTFIDIKKYVVRNTYKHFQNIDFSFNQVNGVNTVETDGHKYACVMMADALDEILVDSNYIYNVDGVYGPGESTGGNGYHEAHYVYWNIGHVKFTRNYCDGITSSKAAIEDKGASNEYSLEVINNDFINNFSSSVIETKNNLGSSFIFNNRFHNSQFVIYQAHNTNGYSGAVPSNIIFEKNNIIEFNFNGNQNYNAVFQVTHGGNNIKLIDNVLTVNDSNNSQVELLQLEKTKNTNSISEIYVIGNSATFVNANSTLVQTRISDYNGSHQYTSPTYINNLHIKCNYQKGGHALLNSVHHAINDVSLINNCINFTPGGNCLDAENLIHTNGSYAICPLEIVIDGNSNCNQPIENCSYQPCSLSDFEDGLDVFITNNTLFVYFPYNNYNIVISGPNGYINYYEGMDVSNFPVGSYQVFIYDSGTNCSAFETFVVEGQNCDTDFEIQNSTIINSKCDDATGSISLDFHEGTDSDCNPFTFQWNNGKQTKDLENLAVGKYCVTISSSCKSIDGDPCILVECFDVRNQSGDECFNNAVVTDILKKSDKFGRPELYRRGSIILDENQCKLTITDWSFNGSSLGGSDYELTGIAVPGTYCATYLDDDDCEGEICFEIECTCPSCPIVLDPHDPTNIGDIGHGIYKSESNNIEQRSKTKTLLEIYPNPFNTSFVIRSSSDKSKNYFIYSSVGQIIKKGVFLKEQELDLSYVSSGIYLIKVVDNEGNAELRKLLKR